MNDDPSRWNDKNESNSIAQAMEESTLDKGHRLGNFHNYYSFHPPKERLDILEHHYQIFERVMDYFHSKKGKTTSESKEKKDMNKDTFRYCDLGCNEGDMSIGVSERLMKMNPVEIQCLGLDIDPILIERANQKKCLNDLKATFDTCNVCDYEEYESKCQSFLSSKYKFDLTSLFSTTMWIHVHAGDEGLRNVIQRICQNTNMLLVEPQSSKR